MATLKNTNIDDTGYLKPASGTTAQRPGSPSAGMIRWNTTENSMEVYDGSEWKNIDSQGLTTSNLILNLDAGNTSSYSGTGTNWNDLSVNGFDGTLVNGPSYSSSNGGYLSFDYTNDYVTVSGMENYTYNNGITVEVWYYNGGGTGFYRGMVTNGTVGDRIGGFDLRLGRENYFGGTNNGTNLNWRITTSSGADSLTINANVDEWHQYVGTYDNDVISVYKDGDLFKIKPHTYGGVLKTMSASTTIASSPGTSEYLDGSLSIVRIYHRALNYSEIKSNFNLVKDRY